MEIKLKKYLHKMGNRIHIHIILQRIKSLINWQRDNSFKSRLTTVNRHWFLPH